MPARATQCFARRASFPRQALRRFGRSRGDSRDRSRATFMHISAACVRAQRFWPCLFVALQHNHARAWPIRSTPQRSPRRLRQALLLLHKLCTKRQRVRCAHAHTRTRGTRTSCDGQERLLYPSVQLCACPEQRSPDGRGVRLRLFQRHLPASLDVHLVARQDKRYVLACSRGTVKPARKTRGACRAPAIWRSSLTQLLTLVKLSTSVMSNTSSAAAERAAVR